MKRIAALFLVALIGLAAIVGLAVSHLGWPFLVGYLVLVAIGAVLMVWQAGAMRRVRRPLAEGRTCTCCTTSVHDPVEVR